MWTTRTDKDRLTIEEIERQDDRGAAILAAAYLEDRLTLSIKERLIADSIAQNELFEGMGPLATFHAKTELAYLMGIADARTRLHLRTIRKIRNLFAHDMNPINFESPQIRDLSSNLMTADTMQRLKTGMDAEGLPDFPKELAKSMSIGFKIMARLPDTSRNRYMNTVRFVLLRIELLTHALAAEKAGKSGVGISAVVPEP
jgi:hypothetical protein